MVGYTLDPFFFFLFYKQIFADVQLILHKQTNIYID